jgi:chitin disaccharide deacetylase
MKWLIVNGDDFGASRGINSGIMEAHQRGILTSTSLIVNAPWSEEAALLSHTAPDLSVGLHVNLAADDSDYTELQRQFYRFQELMGRLPTHLDSHHNIHRDPGLLPYFLNLAQQYRLPLREHAPVRYFSQFYGQWGGETHLEQIGVESLVQILETELQEGITELSCHPGYVDPDFHSAYSAEREVELQTLCDPLIRLILTEQSIQLVSFRDLDRLRTSLPV